MASQGIGLLPSLDEWQRWSDRQRTVTRAVRDAKAHLRPGTPQVGVLHRPAGEIRTLVVVDKFSPSCAPAVVEPLSHMDREHTAVLTPPDVTVDDVLPGLTAESFDRVNALGADVRSVLSLGSYLALSGPIERWARQRDIPFHLVQHGLLTPWSPPASPGARILAWSQSDADYWAEGRRDVRVEVVGSQMMTSAAMMGRVETVDDRPVMLGQLHGVELSRRQALHAYLTLCRRGNMQYRPHPNEDDAVSRALHAVMQRRGIEFETSGAPLPTLARPVVSLFSTGTLEAAMRGLPAYVAHPSPTPWLKDFWRRYGLSQWGDEPTAAWPVPDTLPAEAVARIVEAA